MSPVQLILQAKTFIYQKNFQVDINIDQSWTRSFRLFSVYEKQIASINKNRSQSMGSNILLISITMKARGYSRDDGTVNRNRDKTQKTTLLIVINFTGDRINPISIFKPPSKPDLRSVDHTRVCKLCMGKLITISSDLLPTDLVICLLLFSIKTRNPYFPGFWIRLLVRVQQITSSRKDQTTVCLLNLHCFVILRRSYRTIFQTRFITDFHHSVHMRQAKMGSMMVSLKV